MNATGSSDVIDRAAGLAPDDPLFAARRFRAKVVEATEASHDALLFDAVPGLSSEDRLRVAAHACRIAGAATLARHYEELLAAAPRRDSPAASALPAMQRFAETLITNPRLGDRAALETLKRVGLDDAAVVALAQLVAFLSYQLRVVAGLQAMQAAQGDVS